MSEAANSRFGNSADGQSQTRIAKAARYALAALVLVDIVVLTALRIAGTSGPLESTLQTAELACQAVLIVSFAALVLVDFRAAVAIAVLELAVAGASGHWTVFTGGLSGRIMLDAVVIAGGVVQLGLAARAGRLRLGRYTVHAVVLALALPGVWMTLGLINGNRPSDVFGDGNGHFFFAFAIVLAALAQRGGLGWLRRWLVVACAANALVIGALLLLIASGLLSIGPALQTILFGGLDMGGNISSLPNGWFRLYLGSGLYLQVGTALAAWEIIRNPRRPWPWLLFCLLAIIVVATWTRGYWLGGFMAVALVLLFGAGGFRRTAQVLVAAAAVLVALTLIGHATGSPLMGDLYERAASAFGAGEDITGIVSNALRIEQAHVLMNHIAERPVMGWGFGAIAPDYDLAPFGGLSGQTYSYELQYMDLAYKTGVLGLLLFLSFPLRLLFDALRGRLGRLELAAGVSRTEAAVPVAIIASILVVGATNPYLLAAFGLAPIILSIAWLDPFDLSDAA